MSQIDQGTADWDRRLTLAGGGEMGERTRTFDWFGTALGPISGWPQSLRTAVRIMLDSRYAMWLGWGPDLTFFYNDAYARMTLGPKHPGALGRPACEVWSEIWGDIGPRAESVLRTGEATWDEGLLLFLERRGFPEETYHTFSYSPVPDDRGGVGGMLCVVTEDTERTIGERRLRILRDLAARTTEEVRSVEDACQTAVRTVAEGPRDVPFALIYLLDDEARAARLAGATGLPEGSSAASPLIELDVAEKEDVAWPLRRVRESGQAELVDRLEERFGPLRCPPWPEPVRQGIVVPMARPGQARPAGFVVAGISPRLAFDDAYRGFVELLAGQVATAVANARAYEEERRRAESLAELDRAKTAFFSNVSHEFRTPLTLMLGPVEDLLSRGDGELSPSAREQLEVVDRNGLRLLRLVNTLLDFSRIEAGRVRAVYRPTDLAALTAELASVFRSACDRAGLRLVVDCATLDEPVYVDRDMWEKVVLNLVSNAFKFTFEGGITVSLRRADGAAELRVIDTGIGIPDHEMARLFERFHRVEGARGRTHEGSGIGLALVQELVKRHGGSIAAGSVLGEGTTFIIRVPLGTAHLRPEQIEEDQAGAPVGTVAGPFVEEALRWLPDGRWAGEAKSGAPDAAEEGADAGRPPGRDDDDDRPRVLVADDNADMRRYVVRLLAGTYSVDSVPDGEAALAAVRSRGPDLIVTDVMMPRLDGFGLLRALRANPRTAGVPVIMLSARAGEESRVEGMEAGADDYLVKPFGARELLARVSAHLQMARLRREAGESVRISEERLRMALAAARMVAWEWHPLEDRVVLSENAREVLGVSDPPSLEMGLAHAHPEDIGKLRMTLGTVRENGGGFLIQFRVTRPDNGAVVWLEARGHGVGDRSGRVPRLIGVLLDITARKHAEDETRRRSEQLRHLAEVATRLNAAVDVASVAGIVTEEARGLIGTHQAIMHYAVGQDWTNAITVASLSDRYDALRGFHKNLDGSGLYSLVCRSNEPMRLTQEELLAHPAFRRFGRHAAKHPPLRGWLAAPLVGRDGRNLGLIQLSDRSEGDFVAEDEAILVQLAQMASVAIENARLVEDLRDDDRRKDEFLATLAHELRNPLAPIRNGLQVMKLADGDVESVAQARSMMDRQLTQLVRLVDDLMDLSRITRGKIGLHRQRIELAEVVRHAVETSGPLIQAGGHELILDVPPGSIPVDADPARLAQVVSNLLNNAAKYTERGGRITLTAHRRGDRAVVGVRDTGIGIPGHMIARVFEMFTQVERSLERSQGGLGIGLTLVKRLVEMHGGSVEARSEGHGMGSEFVVRLPIATTPAVRLGDGPEARPPTAGRRILVVDDNRDSALSLSLMLNLMGNETRTAHDGLEAIDSAASFRPEVILLDLGMPRLNGYDAARRIRQEPWGRGMVLVALTGWGQEEDRRRSQRAGFDHHLVKPVDPAALESLLAGLPVGKE